MKEYIITSLNRRQCLIGLLEGITDTDIDGTYLITGIQLSTVFIATAVIYESKMKVFDPPHVICFANFEPKREAMSADRWAIVDLEAPVLSGYLQ